MTSLVSHHPKIRVDSRDNIVTVTIDSPATKNACTGLMWVSLGRLFKDIAYSGARAVILTGAGGDFCAGADLSGAGEPALGPPRPIVDGMRVIADMVLAIHDCPVPVIAKVDGVCVGAGLSLALAADLTWCSETARLSVVFARRGLSLDSGMSWLIRERIGVHRAKELAFTARTFSGVEAGELGLVNAVVPSSELDGAVDAVATSIASGPPIALSLIKRQLDNASGISLAQALESEALGQGVAVTTKDMREAMTAYMERRPPVFGGQ